MFVSVGATGALPVEGIMSKINHLAVVVAAIVYYIWGWAWYSVFGNQWRMFTSRTGSDMTVTGFVLSFVMGLLLAYVIAIALADSESPNVARHGVEFGVFMGAGVWLTNLFNLGLYEGRPVGLWAIDGFYVVIGMAIMGAIIGAWRKSAAGSRSTA